MRENPSKWGMLDRVPSSALLFKAFHEVSWRAFFVSKIKGSGAFTSFIIFRQTSSKITDFRAKGGIKRGIKKGMESLENWGSM